jgi:predicted ATP-binding protein involved in virulence
MAILNPHLGDSVVEKTPGVVLIDEIDLHLHPQWQMTILKMLTEVFPRVQFITTTHSPIVLSETKQDEAFELIRNNGYIEARKIGNPKSWYIVDVLSHAFHIYPDEIKNDEVDEYLDLEDQLKIFSDKVKEYVSKPDLVLKNEIEMIFEKLLPSFPEGSPKRKLINSLKELVV